MNNINNESNNNIHPPKFLSHRPPLPGYRPPPPPKNLPPSQSQTVQQNNMQSEQIRAIAFLALDELSNQYIKKPWENPFKAKNKDLHLQFKDNFPEEINKMLNTDSVSEDEKNMILNQLHTLQRLRKDALKEAEADANAILNKLKKLGLNIEDGESKTIQTIDGRSYKCTTFTTSKEKTREATLYTDEKGEPFALVYLSSKGTNCNTNGKAQLNGKKIVCRYMAIYQILHRDDPNWRKVLNDPKKKESEDKLNKFVNDIDVDAFLRQGDRIYMCSPFNIGEALYKLSIDSKNPRPTALFSTNNHIMAVNIEKREKGGVLLKFYDPNHSDDILRILVPSVDHLKNLTIDCLLNEKEFKSYFPENSIENKLPETKKYEYFTKFFSHKPTHELCASFISYDDPMKPTGNWKNTQIESIISKNIKDDPELNRKWLMENLRVSMSMNQNNVKEVITTILTSNTLNKDAKMLCMKASTPKQDRSYPVISASLLFGSKEALKVYIEAVLNHNEFSAQEKYQLLGGLENENSFLYLGFTSEDKNAEQTVMAYVEAVIAATNLPSHYKVNLLRAQIDGLYGLAQCQNNKLVINFIKFIQKCNLKEEEKNKILFRT